MERRRFASRVFLLQAFLVLCLAAAPAAADRWQPLPLWGGDARLVASVDDPSIVYAATRRAGLFRSTNGGRSWQFVGLGPNLLPAEFIDVDPHDADRLYLRAYDTRAAVWSFYRSENGGRSWQRSDAGLSTVNTVAFDPQTPGVMYAGTLSGLYRSRNGGITWRPLGLAGKTVIRIGIAPSDPDVVLASAADEGWTTQRSTDGGRTFTKVIDDYLEIFLFDPDRPQRIYASHFSELYQSDDLGATWTRRDTSITILSMILTRSGVLLAGSFDGVHRSLDGGLTWEPPAGEHAPPPDSIRSLVELDDRILAAGFRNIWRSMTEGRGWRPSGTGFRGHWVDIVEAAGGGDSTLWVSTEAGLFKSGDGGASFQSLLFGLGPYNSGTRVELLAVDPRQPEVAYVFGCCAELSDRPFDFGLLKTEDGGATWRRLPYPGVLREVAVLEVNPGNPDIVYAGGFFEPHGSPCTAARSTDGGETWECIPVLGSRDFSALAIAPRNPRILYAVSGEELFRSTDRGASWSPVPDARTELRRIEVDPFRSERLYALADDELLRSDDGGRTWTRKLAVPQPVLFRDLVLDPVRRNRIWATADTFHPGDAISESSRIFRSDDAGGHWTEVTAGLKPGTVVLDLAVDPDGGDVVYAGTAGRGLYWLRSDG